MSLTTEDAERLQCYARSQRDLLDSVSHGMVAIDLSRRK